MSIPKHITSFLDAHHVGYQHRVHRPAYTAQETAHAQHVSGKELAKTVMIHADGKLLMAVLPASHQVDVVRLSRLLGSTETRLASEAEFDDVFPGCEVGAMPPLGNLYNVPVWADDSLKDLRMIVFNAGTHTDTIRMIFSDFENLVQPYFGSFATLTH